MKRILYMALLGATTFGFNGPTLCTGEKQENIVYSHNIDQEAAQNLVEMYKEYEQGLCQNNHIAYTDPQSGREVKRIYDISAQRARDTISNLSTLLDQYTAGDDIYCAAQDKPKHAHEQKPLTTTFERALEFLKNVETQENTSLQGQLEKHTNDLQRIENHLISVCELKHMQFIHPSLRDATQSCLNNIEQGNNSNQEISRLNRTFSQKTNQNISDYVDTIASNFEASRVTPILNTIQQDLGEQATCQHVKNLQKNLQATRNLLENIQKIQNKKNAHTQNTDTSKAEKTQSALKEIGALEEHLNKKNLSPQKSSGTARTIRENLENSTKRLYQATQETHCEHTKLGDFKHIGFVEKLGNKDKKSGKWLISEIRCYSENAQLQEDKKSFSEQPALIAFVEKPGHAEVTCKDNKWVVSTPKGSKYELDAATIDNQTQQNRLHIFQVKNGTTTHIATKTLTPTEIHNNTIDLNPDITREESKTITPQESNSTRSQKIARTCVWPIAGGFIYSGLLGLDWLLTNKQCAAALQNAWTRIGLPQLSNHSRHVLGAAGCTIALWCGVKCYDLARNFFKKR